MWRVPERWNSSVTRVSLIHNKPGRSLWQERLQRRPILSRDAAWPTSLWPCDIRRMQWLRESQKAEPTVSSTPSWWNLFESIHRWNRIPLHLDLRDQYTAAVVEDRSAVGVDKLDYMAVVAGIRLGMAAAESLGSAVDTVIDHIAVGLGLQMKRKAKVVSTIHMFIIVELLTNY